MRIRTPREAAALGIETVYQDLALCDNLDIVQNMFLGRERLHGIVLDEDAMETAAGRRSPSLAVTTVRSIRQPVASLSGGQRQSVAIAKAVMWNSKLVIIDEPTAALGVAQTRDGARARPPAGRPGARGDDRLAQPERRLRGRRPIAVLHLGRMVAVRPAAELDPQIAVELMTTGVAPRAPPAAPPGRLIMSQVDDPPTATTRPPPRSWPATAARSAELAVPAEIAAGSAREYLRGVGRPDQGGRERRPAGRPRPGADRHPLPVAQPNFLTAGNLVNLLVQGAVFMLLAMGEVFVLLLGEIDLSLGFVAGIGGVVDGRSWSSPAYGWPWWAAIPAALLVCAGIGLSRG